MIKITEPNKVDLEYMSISELNALKIRVEKRLKKMTPRKIKEINEVRHANTLEVKFARILKDAKMTLEELTALTRKEFLRFREVNDVMLGVAEIKLFNRNLFFLDAKPIYDELAKKYPNPIPVFARMTPKMEYHELIMKTYGNNPSFFYLD